MTQKKIDNIKKDYLDGMKYKDIFKKYNITISDLKKIIHKYKLTRDKRELYKGNKNAKNNRGGSAPEGNKNALLTGEYENIYKDVLTDDELKIYGKYKVSDTDMDNLLMKEYASEYELLTIRELRMLKRITDLEGKDKDMTIGIIRKKNVNNNTETLTEAKPTLETIQRIEDGLTRVQEAKRKSRENMIKLGFSKKTLELKEKQIENDLW